MKIRVLSLALICYLLMTCHQSTNNPSNNSPKATHPVVMPDARWTAEDYRNQNWKPAEGQYYFSEQWTWYYEKKGKNTDEGEHSGTMSIYVDPPTGTLLLNREATNYGDEMTDWIIIMPTGKYITGFTGEHGEKQKVTQSIKDFPDYAFRLQQQATNFQRYFKKRTTSKQFGVNTYNNPTITATAYQMLFEQTATQAAVYLATLPFSVRPFYLVQQTNPDLSFPINLDYGYLLPENYLVVEEKYEEAGETTFFHLRAMSPTEYFLDITAYK